MWVKYRTCIQGHAILERSLDRARFLCGQCRGLGAEAVDPLQEARQQARGAEEEPLERQVEQAGARQLLKQLRQGHAYAHPLSPTIQITVAPEDR